MTTICERAFDVLSHLEKFFTASCEKAIKLNRKNFIFPLAKAK